MTSTESHTSTTNPPVPDRDGRYSYDQLAQARLDTEREVTARIERIIERELWPEGANPTDFTLAMDVVLNRIIAAIREGAHHGR